MCSISGASFAPDSTIDRRKLVHGLLKAGEIRGRDASGYGWVRGDEDNVYKQPVRGGQLPLFDMPQDADAFISHTRAATQGAVTQWENNHPVATPEDRIRLVHNGIIYNDDEVREALGTAAVGLADVDSVVIPAILEEYGLDMVDSMQGYAAAAWFDRDTGNTLHLARFKNAPIAYVWAYDGSLVFASTPDILVKALEYADVPWFGSYPKPIKEFADGDYWQVIDGSVVGTSTVSWSITRSTYQSSYYQSMSRATSGGETILDKSGKVEGAEDKGTTTKAVDTGYWDTKSPVTKAGKVAVEAGLRVRTNGSRDIIFGKDGKQLIVELSDETKIDAVEGSTKTLPPAEKKPHYLAEPDPVTSEGDAAVRAGGYVMSNGEFELVFEKGGKFLAKVALPVQTDDPKTIAGKNTLQAGGIVESDGNLEYLFDSKGHYLGATRINDASMGLTKGSEDKAPDVEPMWDDEETEAPESDDEPMVLGWYDEDCEPYDNTPNFYVTDHDGDEHTFFTLTGMLSAIKWDSLNGQGDTLTDDKEIAWVNQVRDIGEFDSEGSYESWVRFPGLVDQYERQFDGEYFPISSMRDGLAFIGQRVMA